MCIHGDKSQPERDWVLSGTHTNTLQTALTYSIVPSSWILSLCSHSSIILSGVAEFRSGKAPILIATDVASRGLGMSCVLKCRANHFLRITKQ